MENGKKLIRNRRDIYLTKETQYKQNDMRLTPNKEEIII